ncbi:hypothetical protein [Rickettsia felis]|nr:hypothetical protein [Rickettsia felis]
MRGGIPKPSLRAASRRLRGNLMKQYKIPEIATSRLRLSSQ